MDFKSIFYFFLLFLFFFSYLLFSHKFFENQIVDPSFGPMDICFLITFIDCILWDFLSPLSYCPGSLVLFGARWWNTISTEGSGGRLPQVSRLHGTRSQGHYYLSMVQLLEEGAK